MHPSLKSPDQGQLWLVSRDPQAVAPIQEVADTRGCRLLVFEDPDRFLSEYVPQVPECLLLDRDLAVSAGAIRSQLRARGSLVPWICLPEIAHAGPPGSGLTGADAPAVRDEIGPWIDKAFAWSRIYQADLQRAREGEERLARLTTRERSVLELVLEGLSSKQIAHQLGIARKTVDVHRAHLGHKLGTDSLAALVRLGIDAGRLEDLQSVADLGLLPCPYPMT